MRSQYHIHYTPIKHIGFIHTHKTYVFDRALNTTTLYTLIQNIGLIALSIFRWLQMRAEPTCNTFNCVAYPKVLRCACVGERQRERKEERMLDGVREGRSERGGEWEWGGVRENARAQKWNRERERGCERKREIKRKRIQKTRFRPLFLSLSRHVSLARACAFVVSLCVYLSSSSVSISYTHAPNLSIFPSLSFSFTLSPPPSPSSLSLPPFRSLSCSLSCSHSHFCPHSSTHSRFARKSWLIYEDKNHTNLFLRVRQDLLYEISCVWD